MTIKKTAGQSKVLNDVERPLHFQIKTHGAKKTPAGRGELKAELIRLIQALENSDDPAIIRNITEGGFLVLRAEELKRIVVLLTRWILDEGE